MRLPCILAAILLAAAVAAVPYRRVVEPQVYDALEKNDGQVDVFVQLPLYNWDMKILETMPRTKRLWHVYNTLQAHSNQLSGPIRELAASHKLQIRPFWIANVIKVSNATAAFIESASKIPAVQEIHVERAIPAPEPIEKQVASNSTRSVEWGIDMVQAPAVWALGYKGQGITVAIIDTGVRGTHVSLKANYRGTITGSDDYNWLDPTSEASPSPSDGHGHGTHVTGTVCGSETSGIGVAPASLWISGKGCTRRACLSEDLLAAGEFLACPTQANGRNPDCSKAPHVINNSWGGGQASTWYQGVISAWHAGGIIPVFAIGNAGPGCGTANSPADNFNVIAVGGTDQSDTIGFFSCRGPPVPGAGIARVKPEVVAPGVDIVSAWYTGDNDYYTLFATSMATPHVTGVIALVLNANPRLTYEQVYSIITSSADRSTLKQPTTGDLTCGGVGWDTFPNNHYGYGRINALRAVQQALSLAQEK